MRRPVLHRSSLAIAAIAAIAMVRIEAAGVFRDRSLSRVPSRQSGDATVERGWPAAFLEQRLTAISLAPKSRVAGSPWAFLQGERRRLSRGALILDAIVAVAIVAAATAAWETRRRRRSHGWQMRLSEMLLVTAGIAGLCGWLAHERIHWQREQTSLRALGGAAAPYAEEFGARFIPSTSPSPPTWVVRLIGESWLPSFLHRCTMIHVAYGSDQAYDGFADAAIHLQQLDKLRVLTVSAPSSRRPIPFDDIAELTRLRVLDLGSYLTGEEATWHVLPSELEKLRDLDRLILPTRESLTEEGAAVVRTNLPQCEVIFADEE